LASTFGDAVEYRRVEFVGPTVSQDLLQGGAIAVLLAVVAMLLYIMFRFEMAFAWGAVAALVHDVLLTIGVFSLTGLEFNVATVAALLLIVGYSMNDTVVVYDRIRENLRKYKKTDLELVLNRSINETLSRTVNTTVTTIMALGALIVLGGPVVQDFSFAMIWGITVGTYSSIFLAAPLLLTFGVRRGTEAAGPKAEGERAA
jgi:preprotein translocase SecF subunit